MERAREVASHIWLPLFALAAVVTFYTVWTVFDLPPQEEIIAQSERYFDSYGLITIFFAAIIEAALLLGWYFPGSLVIVLGVVFAGDDLLQLFGVFLATTLGFWIAYSFNFYLGKYGWYALFAALGFQEALERAKQQLITYGPRAILFTNFHPNLAALTSTAAGLLQMPFRTFALFTVAATLFWNTFWTIVGYTFGEFAIELIGPKFVLPFIALWIAVILVRKWWTARRDAIETSE